ncbi:XdhC family protein [Williamsia deligens]|uniref:XdhC family protein n=1 Tax=Williamsia deligens TaxID=321325 RepID=UPI0027E27F39|nr:XdhC family protein [Williamsia deligens]
MSDVLTDLAAARLAGDTVAVATVIGVASSMPTRIGTVMALLPDGSIAGSVSGGCVEADVVEALRRAAETGVPSMHHYGADDDILAVGLPCGGAVDVVVHLLTAGDSPYTQDVLDDIAADRGVAIATVVDHPQAARIGTSAAVRASRLVGTLGDEGLDHVAARAARDLLADERSSTVECAPDGTPGTGVTVIVETHPPRPRMLVYGATAVADAVARQGSQMGFRVTVCDRNPDLATRRRFPHADEVVVDRPHRHLEAQLDAGTVDDRTVMCALTHDVGSDVALLDVALRRTRSAYVGAIGSRRVHDERVRRLRELGRSTAQLSRLASPIGLDLGARTPQEIAVAVAAQLVTHRRGGTGAALSRVGVPGVVSVGPVDVAPGREVPALDRQHLRVPVEEAACPPVTVDGPHHRVEVVAPEIHRMAGSSVVDGAHQPRR